MPRDLEAGMPRDLEADRGSGSSRLHPVAAALQSAKARTFVGPWTGWVFKTGHRGVGYYRDTPAACADIVEAVDAALAYLEPLAGDGRVGLELAELLPAPAEVRRRKRGKHDRAVKRKRRAEAAAEWKGPGGVEGIAKADTSHRSAGFWAFDTYNSNAADAALTHLEATGADVVLLQELRRVGDSKLACERAASQLGWKLSAVDAIRTAAGGLSSGVAVAARSG